MFSDLRAFGWSDDCRRIHSNSHLTSSYFFVFCCVEKTAPGSQNMCGSDSTHRHDVSGTWAPVVETRGAVHAWCRS